MFEEFREYETNGLIHNNQYPSLSGNGLLYTSQYIMIINEHYSFLTQRERVKFEDAYKSHELESGLMQRTVFNQFGQESIDDYVGCAVASYFIDNGALARRILAYGRKNGYVYNNINVGVFTEKAFLGRFIHLIGLLQYCAGEVPSIFTRIYMGINFIKTAFSKNHDSLIRAYMMGYVTKDKCPILSLSYLFYAWRVRKRYKTFGDLLGEYFANVHHPLAKYGKILVF